MGRMEPPPRPLVARLRNSLRCSLAVLSVVSVASTLTGRFNLGGTFLVVLAVLGFCDICFLVLRQPPDRFTLP
jgi:hypothetical protein